MLVNEECVTIEDVTHELEDYLSEEVKQSEDEEM